MLSAHAWNTLLLTVRMLVVKLCGTGVYAQQYKCLSIVSTQVKPAPVETEATFVWNVGGIEH